MNIQTKYIGKTEVDESALIQFPAGLPGVGDEKEFALLELPGNPVFHILQSTKTVAIAFIVTSPYHFYPDYTFDLDDAIVDKLQIGDEQDVVVFSIVTLKEPFEKSTINLKAPLVVNSRTGVGKQCILNDSAHLMKATIIPETSLKARGE